MVERPLEELRPDCAGIARELKLSFESEAFAWLRRPEVVDFGPRTSCRPIERQHSADTM